MELPREITLAADMHGCPNRCRHCYLGQASRGQLTPDDLRQATRLLRDYIAPGEHSPFLRRLAVCTWVREPDYAPSYRELYALEAELSDGPPLRFDLLSVWRLARDPTYARWAADIGTTACQISFFGVGRTQDWFYRRRGAFHDCLTATQRLQQVGIRPRWQLFITRRLLPELDDLLALARTLEVWDGTDATEGALFAHLPGPDGEAHALEDLRPGLGELGCLPEPLLAASRRWLGREELWVSEAEGCERLREATPGNAPGYPLPERLALYLLPGWDVYSNMGTLEPWWRLGNLQTDGVALVLERYRRALAVGMRLALLEDRATLATLYGDPGSDRAYTSVDDLVTRYIAAAARSRYDAADPFGALS